MTTTCKLGEKGCWNDGKCRATSNCENKIVTNADRIRAMSDEKLEWVIDPAIVPPGMSKSEWLKQPAEE